MCKRHDADGFKRSLQEIMQRGYSMIEACSKEYKILFDTPEGDRADNYDEQIRILVHLHRVVNDILHPAHERAKNLFPVENTPFIDNCITMNNKDRESGLTNPCSCHKPIEKKNE